MTNSTNLYIIKCSGIIHQIPTEKSYKIQIYIIFIVCLLVFIPGAILNLLLMVSILRKRALQTLPNYLIVNVLLDNVCTSVVVIFWNLIFLLGIYEQHNCILYMTSKCGMHICVCLSVSEVILLAFERYVAIFKPWYYTERIKAIKRTFIASVVLIWICSAVLGTITYITAYFLVIKFFIACLIPVALLISITIHIKLFCTTNTILEEIKKTSIPSKNECSHPRSGVSKTHDHRLYVITFLTIVQLVVCFLPLCLVLLYQLLVAPLRADISILYNWVKIVSSFKVLFNPLTYLYQLKSYRTAFTELLQRKESPDF